VSAGFLIAGEKSALDLAKACCGILPRATSFGNYTKSQSDLEELYQVVPGAAAISPSGTGPTVRESSQGVELRAVADARAKAPWPRDAPHN